MLHVAAKSVYTAIDETYGRRRLAIELRQQRFNIVRYPVRLIMKSLLLVATRPGRHR